MSENFSESPHHMDTDDSSLGGDGYESPLESVSSIDSDDFCENVDVGWDEVSSSIVTNDANEIQNMHPDAVSSSSTIDDIDFEINDNANGDIEGSPTSTSPGTTKVAASNVHRWEVIDSINNEDRMPEEYEIPTNITNTPAAVQIMPRSIFTGNSIRERFNFISCSDDELAADDLDELANESRLSTRNFYDRKHIYDESMLRTISRNISDEVREIYLNLRYNYVDEIHNLSTRKILKMHTNGCHHGNCLLKNQPE